MNASGRTIRDEVGREWLVLPGDPAWRWARQGHRYLPAATILTGEDPDIEDLELIARLVGDTLPYYRRIVSDLRKKTT